MEINKSPHPTYSEFNDMLSWNYNIQATSTKFNLKVIRDRSYWLAEIVASVLSILPGFANPREIDISTDTKGDNGLILKNVTPEGLRQIDQFLRNTPDITDVGFFVDLLCQQIQTDNSLEEFSISGCCWIVIDNNFSECNLMYLEQAPASIRLALGTDIYSPFTLSPLRDNRNLAALNGPRLRSFLHRLHAILPLTLTDINDHGYERLNLVDEYGFKMPKDLESFEKILQP